MKKALKGEELESVEARLEELDRKLDRLRVLYESHFMGIERTPPNTLRRDANRQILEMQQVPIGNATVRFRFQSLLQRWVLLTSYWNRTMREIEMGTYQRDVARAQRHMAARGGAEMTEADALALGIPANRVKAFVARQQRLSSGRKDAVIRRGEEPSGAGAPGEGAARAPVAEGANAVPGLRPGDLEAFYQRYVAAHTEATGAAPKATIDDLRAKLQRELPKLVGEAAGTRVALDVVVEDGRVRLKAKPVR